MTDKNPIYWRTNDNRKVVILQTFKYGINNPEVSAKVWDTGAQNTYTYKLDELVPWIEPATRTVYVHWDMEHDNFYIYKEPKSCYDARLKIIIKEGVFDE